VIGFSGASSFQALADIYFRSAELKPQKTYRSSTMKTLHCLIAGLRPAFSKVANRIAIPSLVVGAALALVQPCAGLSFEFQETGSLAMARESHTATLLRNGQVLVAGGSGIADAELYESATGTWATTGSLITGRSRHTATLLADGKVLVAGGSDGSSTRSAELYDPAVGTWEATGPLGRGREDHTATLLSDGRVLVAGGFGTNSSLDSAEIYDLASGTWSATASMASARNRHTATLLAQRSGFGGGRVRETASPRARNSMIQ
jgi:hypothetical protein